MTEPRAERPLTASRTSLTITHIPTAFAPGHTELTVDTFPPDAQHFHLLHSGRALYTLIQPPASATSLPTVHRVTLGHDIAAGETPQLFVPGGWWKASELPQEDLALLQGPGAKENKMEERVGCLISEIVVPGWNPDQHAFLDEDKVSAVWFRLYIYTLD